MLTRITLTPRKQQEFMKSKETTKASPSVEDVYECKQISYIININKRSTSLRGCLWILSSELHIPDLSQLDFEELSESLFHPPYNSHN